MTTPNNTASGAADDSLLLCASDLQHSAIHDNLYEMIDCAHAVAERIMALAASAPVAPTPPADLTVWFGSLPESNGKKNWSAILHRKGATGFEIFDGFQFARSEHHDRVRYDADCMRHLIGELAEQPDLLAYDGDMLEPATLEAAPVAPTRIDADRLTDRLMSSDPEFDDCADAASLIQKQAASIELLHVAICQAVTLLNAAVNPFRVVEANDILRHALVAYADSELATPEAAPVAPAPQPAAPEGYVLVPVEPTPAMGKAAADAWLDCGSRLVLNKAAAAVAAGIAAAPKAASLQQDEYLPLPSIGALKAVMQDYRWSDSPETLVAARKAIDREIGALLRAAIDADRAARGAAQAEGAKP